MVENHTHSEFEDMRALVSAQQFLLEILLANLWAGCDDRKIQDDKERILKLTKTPSVSRSENQTAPEAVQEDFRVAHLVETHVANILNRAEERRRSGK